MFLPGKVSMPSFTVLHIEKRRGLRISDNLVITRVLFSYRTDSQNVQNRFLYGWDHSGIQAGSSGSEYMVGIGMMDDKV